MPSAAAGVSFSSPAAVMTPPHRGQDPRRPGTAATGNRHCSTAKVRKSFQSALPRLLPPCPSRKTSVPRFGPWPMPDNTRSGGSGSNSLRASSGECSRHGVPLQAQACALGGKQLIGPFGADGGLQGGVAVPRGGTLLIRADDGDVMAFGQRPLQPGFGSHQRTPRRHC